MTMPFEKQERFGRFAGPLLAQLYQADWRKSGLLETPGHYALFSEAMEALEASALKRTQKEAKWAEAKFRQQSSVVVAAYQEEHKRAVQEWKGKLDALKALSPNVVSLIEFYDYLNEKLKVELLKLSGVQSPDILSNSIALLQTRCEGEFSALFHALNDAFHDKFSAQTALFLKGQEMQAYAFFKKYFSEMQALCTQALPLSQDQLYGFFYFAVPSRVSQQTEKARSISNISSGIVLPARSETGRSKNPLRQRPSSLSQRPTRLGAAEAPMVSSSLEPSRSRPASPDNQRAQAPDLGVSEEPAAPAQTEEKATTPPDSADADSTVSDAEVKLDNLDEIQPVTSSSTAPAPLDEASSALPQVEVLRPRSRASDVSSKRVTLISSSPGHEAILEQKEREEPASSDGLKSSYKRPLGSNRYPNSTQKTTVGALRPLGRRIQAVDDARSEVPLHLAGVSGDRPVIKRDKPAAQSESEAIYRLAKTEAARPLQLLIDKLGAISYQTTPGDWRGIQVQKYKASIGLLMQALQNAERVSLASSKELSQFFTDEVAKLKEQAQEQPGPKVNLEASFEAFKRGLIKRIGAWIQRLDQQPSL